MSLKQVTVPVDGVDTTFNNTPFDALTNPHGLPNGGWRQNDNLFNLLLGILAAAAPALKDASATSSVAIGTGTKTLAATNGRPTPVGMPCFFIDAANSANYVWGLVTANAGTAGGNITINATLTGGSGTPASWTIQPSGPRGPAGSTPGFFQNALTFSASVTITAATGDVIICQHTSAQTVNLPAGASAAIVDVYHANSGADVTVHRSGTDTIYSTAADFVLDLATWQGKGARFAWDGSTWRVFQLGGIAI